jgi:predicted transposase/invertase (TIGR01784 family)
MKKALHQIHDKFFKNSLKEKKIAIDFLKAYLSPSVYEKIDINSLQLTEKSFVIPELREIHSDIIYKCCINEKSAYLFFLIEHESTTKDELMAFRMLHYMVSLSYNHLRQGHKKLPIILPLCLYHGEDTPYPHSTELYDCFDDPELARELAFKPFKLIDLTVLSDEEISQHGLAALLEMLFKHHRSKQFLSIMRQLIQSNLIQDVIRQLDIAYLTDMLNYIVNTGQDETDPQAAQHLIHELIQVFPQEREVIMTFAQQLKQEGRQKGLQEGIRQGRRQEGILIAKKMLAKGLDIAFVKELVDISENELADLEKA